MMRLLLAIVLLMPCAAASAHVSAGDSHGDGWSADPLVLIPMLAVSGLYLLGILRLWRRAGAGRGIPRWRAAAFALGMAALAAAVLSSLDAAAEASFGAHMLQHMLLIVVAAPLIALGSAGAALVSGLPAALRQPVAKMRHLRRMVATVPVATALHGVTVWLWHAPALYEAALRSDPIHYLEHVSMFGTGVLFWWSVINARAVAPLGYGAGIAALFLTMLHSGLLGILITLARVPLYATYTETVPLAGLSPLEDQQLAGVVMLFGGFAYLAGGMALLGAWLGAAAHRHSSRGPA